MRDLWRFIGFGHGWPLGVALLLGCLLLGADVSQGGADICGCASNPNNLGDFDTANPASYPPGTVSAANGFGGNNITIPLSADGVLGGVPATAGTYLFTVGITDANGVSITQSFRLVVEKAPPTVTKKKPTKKKPKSRSL